MSIPTNYKKQVELLLDVLPLIQDDPRFALKGGTAINLFFRNMPRLSVDIDLTYLPIEPRNIFLINLTQAMKILSDKMTAKGLHVEKRYSGEHIIKLLVSNDQAAIKVEPNTVLRGCVFEPEIRELSESAQATFLQTQKSRTASLADLYAGKICAALDRQHPRDLFDIHLLYQHEGLTDRIRSAFVVYLASGPRPMVELLQPNMIDQTTVYHNEFIGMALDPISYDELAQVRVQLVKDINQSLTSNERHFLLSVKQGNPDYSLMPFDHLDQLPALQWKVINVNRMDRSKHTILTNKLKSVLEI